MEKLTEQSMPMQYPCTTYSPELTAPETNDPTWALHIFFREHSLNDIVTRLKIWLADVQQTGRGHVADHAATYSEIVKLVDAAYLIYKGQAAKHDQDRLTNDEDTWGKGAESGRKGGLYTAPTSFDNAGLNIVSALSEKNGFPVLTETGSRISPALQRVLNMIVELIGPEKIFLLEARESNIPGEKTLYDLLIALPGSAAGPHDEYMTIVEHISKRVHPVTALVLNMGDLRKMLSAGHIYYSRVCSYRNLIYDDGRSPLPCPVSIPVTDIISRAEKDFNCGIHRAQSFLEGARRFSAREEKELAAFMLHQAAEQTCRAILRGLAAHDIVSHNLRLLMKRCERCIPGLSKVFPTGENEDRLLQLLQKAYINTRYKNNYEISEPDLMTLLNRVDYLRLFAKKSFSIKISEAAEALNQH
jgi:HEPN domain-containing protein